MKFDGNLYAYEIKSGATYSPDFFKSISKWAKLSGTPTENLSVIYAGEKDLHTKEGKLRAWQQL